MVAAGTTTYSGLATADCVCVITTSFDIMCNGVLLPLSVATRFCEVSLSFSMKFAEICTFRGCGLILRLGSNVCSPRKTVGSYNTILLHVRVSQCS
jgi:hypothetical protein